MTKTEQKICQNCKTFFVIEPEDFDFYKKMGVPPPTWCPECRLVRRLMWRNERSLYHGKCALCGTQSFSMYPKESDITAYCVGCWNSDKWDPLSFGIDYDFSKPFFEQFRDLFRGVPRKILQQISVSSSNFANYVDDSKNVFMSFSVVLGSENVFYSKNIDKGFTIYDSTDIIDSDNCYNNINGEKNYNSIFLINSKNCIDSAFLYDCVNCKNCFLSSNLRNKSFCIKNKQYSKEEYAEELKKQNFGSRGVMERILDEFQKMRISSLHKYAYLINCANVTGDEVRNSKNAKNTFVGYDFENVKNVFRSFSMKDSMDITNAAFSELFYEYMAGGGNYSRNIKFCINGMRGMDDVAYSDFCGSSSHLFGCIGLRNKEYCILNKQYTKEEYEALVPKIKEHMMAMPYVDAQGRVYAYGEFFPPELSPFAYNETIAQEYFPLTKAEAFEKGFRWRDPDTREYQPTQTPEALPDHITDVPDSITNEIIQCAHSSCTHQCTTAFRIIPEELQFYRRMNLPLPRLCPNCRHYERLAQRNPLRLWHRQCMCAKDSHGHTGTCPNEFETSYAPDRKEIIYCESCYQAEVI